MPETCNGRNCANCITERQHANAQLDRELEEFMIENYGFTKKERSITKEEKACEEFLKQIRHGYFRSAMEILNNLYKEAEKREKNQRRVIYG